MTKKPFPKSSDTLIKPLEKTDTTVVKPSPTQRGMAVERTLGAGTKVLEWSPSTSLAADTPQRTPNVKTPSSTEPAAVPLHQRLKAFRNSTPLESIRQKPLAETEQASDSTSTPLRQPPWLAAETQTATQTKTPSEATPITPERLLPVPGTQHQPSVAARPPVGNGTLPRDLSGGVASLVERPASGPTARLGAPARSTADRQRGVLFHRQSPVLSVETVGPRKISVGKESAFELTIENAGDVAADEVVVYVNLPQWTDVVGAQPSTGATHPAVSNQPGEPFQWRVGHLEAKSQERLVLTIMPRESRPFDLGVRWDYRSVVSKTMIEVQEPKLVMSLDGPQEILYGEQEVFLLKLSNVGTGAAENVVITLSPNGTADNQPVSQNLGVIEAGGQKTIEVELTARQTGNLTIQVSVRGDAGVYAELTEQVLVRRAALQVDVQGPQIQYVGSVASYQIRISNPGTAPAKNLQLSINMPPGAKYLSGIDNCRLEANGTKIVWTLENLNPSSEQSFVIQCSMGLPGSSRIEVFSRADSDLTASANTVTRVEAIADLALRVTDPSGPIPVGEEISYELKVSNRGTKNADNVEVVAYFSHGIEPIKAEGAPYRVTSGQVVFSPIPSVVAGGEVTLIIRARAATPGNHVFRAEVICKETETRLLCEETTHFYQTGAKALNALGTSPAKPTMPAPSAEPPRTADRRQSTVPLPIAGPAPPSQETQPTPAVLR